MIRPISENDIKAWSKMRTALWPDTDDGHKAEIEQFFSGTSIDIEQVFVAEVDGQVAGFIELNLRSFAEGSRNSPVPFVEGWYVQPEFQGRGLGRLLMQQAETWAMSLGYDELASDTETFNEYSIKLHQELGFVETERVVCFLKSLSGKR